MRRLLGHIGAAIVGYIAAAVAAGFSIILMMVASNLFYQLTDPTYVPSDMTAAEQFDLVVYFGILAVIIIAATAFVPAVPAIIVLLLARRTDIVSYIVAGIAVSVSAVMIARRNILFLDRLEVDWPIVMAGGVAGAVFWAVLRMMTPRPAKPA